MSKQVNKMKSKRRQHLKEAQERKKKETRINANKKISAEMKT